MRPSDAASLEIDTAEPHVMRYVVDALTEEPDEDPALTVEEFWHLFAVLKTVVETLHEVAGARRPV